MKIFGSISRLVSIIFRKDGQDLTVRPNQSTTYTAARDIQLPSGDADHELVGTSASQTLSNKSMSGDSNTFSNIGLGSLKVELSDADKLVVRNASGAVISSKLENKHVASDAAISLSKLASVSASKALVSDANGVISASSVSSTELGYLAGVTSGIQSQLDSKASSASVASSVSDLEDSIAAEQAARESADSALDARLDVIEGSDSTVGSIAKAEKDAKDYADAAVSTLQGNIQYGLTAFAQMVTDSLAALSTTDGQLSGYITDEQNARQLADADLQSDIDGEISARQAAITNEANTRSAADAALDARLDVLEGVGAGSVAAAQADAISAAESYTDSAIATEQAAREAADSDLASDLSAETSARQAADSALDARLDVLEGSAATVGSVAKAEADAKAYADQKVADLVNSAPAMLDTLKELADAINSDANFAATVANNIASEASARQAADTALQSSIDSVESAFQAADSDLQDAIDAEAASRAAADSAHDAAIALKLNKPSSGDGANKYLRSNGDGSTYWDDGFIPAVFKANWSAASGTNKVVVHNLGSTDVVVSFIDLADNSVIGVDSVVVTDSNTVTLSASEAPSASGWRVLVQKI